MTLSLGALALRKVKRFTILEEVGYPAYPIVGKATGTIDPDAYDRKSTRFEVECDVNDADRQTLEGFVNSLRTLADPVIAFSEIVHVERVESRYMLGRHFSSRAYWRCHIGMIISNT